MTAEKIRDKTAEHDELANSIRKLEETFCFLFFSTTMMTVARQPMGIDTDLEKALVLIT